MNLEDEASAKVIALKYHALALDEIVEWAEKAIKALDNPDLNIISLSLVSDECVAMNHLKSVGINTNKNNVAKLFFGHFYNALDAGKVKYVEISKALYFLARDGYVPGEGLTRDMQYFKDALDLAEAGTYGDPENIKKEMLTFLKKYRAQ